MSDIGIVYGKKNGIKMALATHGRQGWKNGELVIFYNGLGWVTKNELEEAITNAIKTGSVFASRTCFIPARETPETIGWLQSRPRRRRIKVVRLANGQWVSCKVCREASRPSLSEILVPSC